jgi:hypothetical protein
LKAEQPELGGLVSDKYSDLNEVALLASLPRTLERIQQTVVGKQVLLGRATGLNPAKKLVASSYADRHYATFTLPASIDASVAALKADLLVSDDLPPLTLLAARAIATAERGDLQAAGGVLNRVFAEPLATRFVTLPEVAGAILPLGTLPQEPMREPSLYQLLLRSEVQPSWVRHEYFLLQHP